MTRSRLKHRVNKCPNDINKHRYKQQRNYCVNLTRRVKKVYYSNLDIKNINDNIKFWDSIKLCFSHKNASKDNITVIENGQIITDDTILADTFNKFFSSNIDLPLNSTGGKPDTTLDINLTIDKFKDHPSIVKLKENIKTENTFSHTSRSIDDIKICIQKLNVKKHITYNNTPAKISMEYMDICSEPIHMLYNKAIVNGTFPSALSWVR